MKAFFKKIIVFILTVEAKLVLRKYRPKIVAVTGNIGKTSTKDAIFTVLSAKYHVRKSDKSFNSEIGVPLTILGRPNAWSSASGWVSNIFEGILLLIKTHDYPKWLVLEVGADRPGDISSTAKWLKPTIAVITRLPELPVHVEFFPSAEAVRVEKLSLIREVVADGVIIGNGDDAYIREAFGEENRKKVFYGIKKDADVHGETVSVVYQDQHATGIRSVIKGTSGEGECIIHGTIGIAHMYAALGALAVGQEVGVTIPEGIRALDAHETPPGRMRLIAGTNNTTLIDDTYNSSPSALEAALGALKSIRGSRKIAVLGDMLELGERSIDAHTEAGKLVAGSTALLITVGIRARGIALSAQEHGLLRENIFSFDSAKQAADLLISKIQPGDVILVKGSQSIRLERVVEALMAHPEQKKKLLVRQDEEWMKR